MEEITKLKEQRAKVVAGQRAMQDKADAEERDLTAEEQEEWDKLDKEFDSLSEQIRTKEKEIERRDQLQQREQQMQQRDGDQRFRPNPDNQGGNQDAGPRGSREYREAFWHFVRQSRAALFPEEVRALQVGTDSEGGYLVPDEFNRTLIQALEDFNIMRGLCKVINTASGTTEIPVVSSHGAAAWTAEEAAFTEGDEAFTQVTLSAYKAGTIMKVSEELLNDNAFDLEAYIVSEYARRIGALEEAAFVNGDGSGKPTGVTDGAGVGKTAASATAVTTDELIDLFHSLGRPYRPKATWLMADASAKAVRKLKDSDNQYMWQPGLQAGQPDRLLSRPVEISDSCEAMTAALKPILFGDFSYYWIADRQGRSFQRLNELYAANGQVGFRAFQRVDGKLTLAAAMKCLQMAAV